MVLLETMASQEIVANKVLLAKLELLEKRVIQAKQVDSFIYDTAEMFFQVHLVTTVNTVVLESSVQSAKKVSRALMASQVLPVDVVKKVLKASLVILFKDHLVPLALMEFLAKTEELVRKGLRALLDLTAKLVKTVFQEGLVALVILVSVAHLVLPAMMVLTDLMVKMVVKA